MSTAPKSNRTTHTPGPWSVDLDRDFIQDGDQVSVEALTPDGTMVVREVCSLFLDTGENKDGEDYEEDAANARLIAAAPELLEAAKDAITLMRFMRDREHWAWDRVIANTDSRALETWDALKAAIAKAEGR